ncbi:MAG: extracellular solute-binding protein, partial [Ruthenibacterium sp.]
MKLKKLTALVLSVALSVTILAGCSPAAPASSAAASSATASQPASVAGTNFEVMGDSLKYDPNMVVNHGEPVTLNIWVPAAWESFYKKWTEDYQKYHPNVSFEFTITSFEDHWKKVPLAIQSKDGPDLFWMHNDASQIMIPHMEPLSEEQFPMEQLKNDFLQVESNVIDDKLYYTDLGLMTGVIFYNKDLWTAAGLSDGDIPKTWKQLVEVGKKLTVTDDAGNIQVAGFNTNNAEYIWVDMLYQQGKWLFAEDNTTVMFTSPEAEKAAQMMYDMYHTEKIGGGTQPKGEEAFANGKAAMIYCWGWASNYFKSNFPDLNYGAFALPTFTEDAVAYGRNNGDVTLGVSKYSDAAKKEAALNFVQYELCNDDMIIEF